MKGCVAELSAWGKSRKGNYGKRILVAQQRLQEEMANKGNVQGARAQIENLLGEEEIYWRQRARVDWMKWGDRNSKWFHQRATQRRKCNRIEGLWDTDGRWVEDEEGMEQIVVGYFQNLFVSNGQ